MISKLLPIEIEDTAIICNYINDEAHNNGVSLNPYAVSANIEYAITDPDVEAWKVMDDDILIAFMIYEEKEIVSLLGHFYIQPKYRTVRSVIIPMVQKLVDKFKGKKLIYTKLHNNVDTTTHYAENGEILISKLEELVNRIGSR